MEPDFTITNLGIPAIQSPVLLSNKLGDSIADYVSDDERILYNIHSLSDFESLSKFENRMELCGPREKIFFNPNEVHSAIVTCGGICPGLNDVIRAIVMTLFYRYGVKKISGIKNGYRGFLKDFNYPFIELNPLKVEEIHRKGGTILGSSRGYGERTSDIIDSIEKSKINILFTIGGDGTHKGSLKLAQEAEKRGLKLSIIGVPKTIDNDLSFVERTFGFETAVSHAVDAVAAAHVEAHDSVNGIGLVKVMGRNSGFIAANTALAINDVNFVLVPEVPFDLDGNKGLFYCIKERLVKRNHAVILLAEGAGLNHLEETNLLDPSGNKIFQDIGIFIKNRITSYFKNENIEINLKYIDPSYMIRSAPANPNDSIYCTRLGNNAVHAAMSGKTKMLVSFVNNYFVHLPIEKAISKQKKIDPESPLWRDVLESTGQPIIMKN